MTAALVWALSATLASAAPPPGAAKGAGGAATTVRIAHFSDYHSHAVPFHAAGEAGVGGLARAVAFLAPLAKDERTLVFSGGDMLNKGAPAWSDKYGCTEWPWLDGIVSAMALGNHDADYGPDAFARCRAAVRYPILCANALDGEGRPLLAPYAVFVRSGVRIGVLAVAGPDFGRLVSPGALPLRGARFSDPVEAARRAVRALREGEKVDAVVLIGHEHHDDDVALAVKVPGIDLVLGSHSHLESPLERIPGTATWTISGGSYLENVTVVTLTFRPGAPVEVTGRLERMGPSRPQDPETRTRIDAMQARLQADPAFAPLFVPVAELPETLETAGGLAGTSRLGGLVAEAMRAASGAHVALTTASSIREPLPRGVVVEEQLRAALPYPNRILVYEVTGERLLRILSASASRAGSDLFSQSAGVRSGVEEGRPVDVAVLRDPSDPGSGEAPLSLTATYRLATTDFMANAAEPYRSLLADLVPRETGLAVRDAVRRSLRAVAPGTEARR